MAYGKVLMVGAVILGLTLGGCEERQPSNGQIFGTVGGAGAGAVIGHVATATARGTMVGAAIGALVGLGIGTYFDPAAEAQMSKATVHAAQDPQTGQPVAWRTGRSSGRVVATGQPFTDHGRTCRPIRQEQAGDGDGKPWSRDVVACESQPGLWEIVGAELAAHG